MKTVCLRILVSGIMTFISVKALAQADVNTAAPSSVIPEATMADSAEDLCQRDGKTGLELSKCIRETQPLVDDCKKEGKTGSQVGICTEDKRPIGPDEP